MQHPEGNEAPDAPPADAGAPATGESLRAETGAAVGAVAAYIRNVSETAKTEVELSVASLVSVVAAAVVSLLLVVTAWLSLVAAAVWWAVDNGLPVAAALLIAGGIHLAVVLVLFFWTKSLLSNIGFSRTRQLVFPESKEPE